MTCAVCEKHRTKSGLPGGAIFEDQYVFVAHFPALENEPAHYGHVILEFKRHIVTMSELTSEEAEALGQWTQKITSMLEKKLKAEHVYMVRIGDVVAHLHFHFVPRFPNTPKEAWSPLLFRRPESRKASRDDMIEITRRLREALN